MSSHLAQSIPALCLSWIAVGCMLFNGWASKPGSQSKAQNPQPTAQEHHLPAKPQTLNPGEKHTYPLTLKAGDYLKLTVEQQGIDVVVRLFGPDGKKLAEVDSPNGTQGPEPVSSIVEQSGSYRLEVESLEKTGTAGKYELKLESVKPATEQDRARIEIDKLIVEVEQLWQAGKHDQAVPLAQQALEKSEKIFGPEHLLAAKSLNILAVLYKHKSDYTRAEPLYERCLAICEKVLGPDHPDVAASLKDLADLYQSKGDYPRSESFAVRSLATYEKALGPDHPAVATSLSHLANLYLNKGDFVQAEPLLKRGLTINEKAFGPDHSQIATSLNNLAHLYYLKGDYAQAELLFQRSLANAWS